jgi:hypothetical protein
MPKSKRRSIDVQHGMLPVFNSGQRVGPSSMTTCDDQNINLIASAFKIDVLWSLLRFLHPGHQLIPSWTGFNISLRESVPITQSAVHYLQPIDAPATEFSTIHEILQQSLKIKNQLQLEAVVCVFDQAIYSKIVEVIWKQKELYNGIVVRMGDFHTACIFLAILGK